ncbi:unnamed protein product [Pedinophyceae sp. YPF-701]|nr:unnamed protein product [Pedinophyceae sp. YPF-701]
MPHTRSHRRCLVTGGAGFVGQHLVLKLLDAGWDVVVFDLRPLQGNEFTKVESVVGNLNDEAQLVKALQGVDVVFHVATLSPTGANARNKKLMTQVNVDGTRTVVEACKKAGVGTLVYTSSSSVVFNGQDLVGCTEAQPYPDRFLDFYSETKMRGEKIVLDAASSMLATVSLRPSSIFGERDMLMVPTTVAKARQGKMKFMIGNGENLCDWTYVGNVAQAHLDAAEALLAGKKVSGKAYFITNDEPRTFWGFMGDILEGLGYSRPSRKLPFGLIYAIAVVLQFIFWILSPFVQLSTDFTTFRVKLAACNRNFSCDAAKKDLGYRAPVPMDEAIKRTVAYFKPTWGKAAMDAKEAQGKTA